MAVVYRTPGPWGPGKGSDLTPVEADGNFWQLVQDITAKAVQGVGISNFVVSGNQFTVVLTDHTLLGPYTLPVATLVFKGEWLPGHTYLANEIITHAGSTYIVLFNHTSEATFDPGANDGSGHSFYGLLLQNPAITIPAGGVAGAFLRKVTSLDYAVTWTTAALTDLSDVSVTGAADGDILTLLHGVWTSAHPSTISLSLDGLTDVTLGTLVTNQVLVWNGSTWINASGPAQPLDALSDVVITTPIVGQPLVYDGTNWVNKSVADVPVINSGSHSGSFAINMQTNEFVRIQMTGNCTVSGFTWPTGSSGLFVRRIVEMKNNGSFTLTWPSGTKWPSGGVPIQTTNATDVYAIFTYDGGASVFASVVAQGYV